MATIIFSVCVYSISRPEGSVVRNGPSIVPLTIPKLNWIKYNLKCILHFFFSLGFSIFSSDLWHPKIHWLLWLNWGNGGKRMPSVGQQFRLGAFHNQLSPNPQLILLP
jgi:hypothetical protein